MFEHVDRKKPQRKKVEDIVREAGSSGRESGADLPPPPPARIPVPHRWRRRILVGVVSLVAVALLVSVAQGTSRTWQFVTDQLGIARFLGVRPIASHLFPERRNSPYPKTLAGLVAYLQDFFSNARDLLSPSFRIAGELRELSELLPEILNGRRGPDFIASLKRLRDSLGAINQLATEDAQTTNIAALQTGLELFRGQTGDAKAFLDESIRWLEDPEPHHVAVLFGNSAEMRPGGGFVGSFAEVTIENGAVTAIAVHDINDVDRGFEPDIVPPLELQPLVGRWRTADANWFFNFPDSARTVLRFMNGSELYTERGVELDGVIALSPGAIEDVLRVTGPLKLADGTEITADTFLKTIQTDVQEGHDTGSDNPKAILGELVSSVIGKISSPDIGPARSLELLSLLYEGLQKKDIVVYFTDQELENVVDRYGWGGRLYDLPRNFAGDYVAVTTSNIGGAKTDAVIENKITVRETLLSSGLLETHVKVLRKHTGEDEDVWWYRAAHEGIVQVFAPPGIEVLSAGGLWERAVQPRSFGGSFTRDPLVQAVERTRTTFPGFPGLSATTQTNRSVLSFWQRIDAGTTGEAEIGYVRPLPDPVTPGTTYTFVVERQPASTAEYDIEITAPPGYKWKEEGSSIYRYTTDDLPGRLIVRLTLARDE